MSNLPPFFNQHIAGGVTVSGTEGEWTGEPGIVFDESQLSAEEAADAVDFNASIDQEGSTMPTEDPQVQIEQADEITFETGELAPAIGVIVEESKKGYRTTEFWIALGVSLLTVLDGVPLPEKFEGAVVTLIGAAYIISRGLAKKGVGNVTPLPVIEDNTPPA